MHFWAPWRRRREPTRHLGLNHLGHAGAVLDAAWPRADPAALVSDTVSLVVQVNGKLRGQIDVAKDASQDAILAAALADPNVQKFLSGEIRKKIVVPGRLVNLVVAT